MLSKDKKIYLNFFSFFGWLISNKCVLYAGEGTILILYLGYYFERIYLCILAGINKCFEAQNCTENHFAMQRNVSQDVSIVD